MSTIRRRDALKLVLAAPFVVAPDRLFAQAWPAKPVRIIASWAPGGGADTTIRIIFNRVQEILGQPLVMDNRAGGASLLAAQAVHSAPRDGYTFLANGPQQVVLPLMAKDLPIDFGTAFVPVSQHCTYPLGIVVLDTPRFKTLADLVNEARANPDKVRCGTSTPGTMPHLVIEELERRAGVKILYIPYRVSPEIPRDILSGQIELTVMSVGTIKPYLDQGKVRLLGMNGAKRVPVVPHVPTIAEQGYPGFDMGDWGGTFAAAGVPDPIIRRFQAAIAEAAKDPGVLERLSLIGNQAIGSTPEEFSVFMERSKNDIATLIKENNLTM
jgi:tripartite-type tricarboxylate transporter receptor subunit TctC